MRKLLDRTIPKNISIKMTCCDDLMSVSADPTQIEQIMLNLALNAKDVMPDGGEIEVETTKPAGSGTGLGLSIVYGIVVNHRGLITCESALGLGTTFRVYFPAMMDQNVSKNVHEVDKFHGGSETNQPKHFSQDHQGSPGFRCKNCQSSLISCSKQSRG